VKGLERHRFVWFEGPRGRITSDKDVGGRGVLLRNRAVDEIEVLFGAGEGAMSEFQSVRDGLTDPRYILSREALADRSSLHGGISNRVS